MKSLPDNNILSHYLSSLIINSHASNSHLTILSRKPFINSSTYPAEIINCNVNNDGNILLFCKYSRGRKHDGLGHRGGILYEIKVYDEVLKHLQISMPKFYGDCYIPVHDETLMVIEYLEESVWLSKTSKPAYYLEEAARWIARLHSYFERKSPSSVTVYDKAYFSMWVEEVKRFTMRLNTEYSWITSLCTYFFQHMDLLISYPPTFIHGEYYPQNILVKNHIVYPIDWESAASGPGTIDLASLIEWWDEEASQNAVKSYKAVHWSDKRAIPPNFDQVLLLSQIYFQFRWMAEFMDVWLKKPHKIAFLGQLAKRAGCI